MTILDVKNVFQTRAREEFDRHPVSFAHSEGSFSKTCAEKIWHWAMNTWEHRTNEEIQRDARLELEVDNYISWAFEAFRNKVVNSD